MNRSEDFTDLPPIGMIAVPLLTGLASGFVALVTLVASARMGSTYLVYAALAALLVAAAAALAVLVWRARRGEQRPWSTSLRLLAELFVAPRVLLLFVTAGAATIAVAPGITEVVRTVAVLGVIVVGLAWAQTGVMGIRRKR